MPSDTSRLYTVSELAAEAALALASVDQQSGRVRQAPSLRSIRYYNAHGLLDPPVRFQGRTALYGHRHLLQLIAIKHLQSREHPLVEIQQRLLGIGDAELARLTGLSSAPAANEPAAERDEAFWASLPSAPSSASSARGVEAVRLDPSALLLLEGLQRPVHDDDIEALRIAAAPLLKLLRARQLVRRAPEVSP